MDDTERWLKWSATVIVGDCLVLELAETSPAAGS